MDEDEDEDEDGWMDGAPCGWNGEMEAKDHLRYDAGVRSDSTVGRPVGWVPMFLGRAKCPADVT